MADDKKNIGPEAEKPGDAPQEKKAEPVKDTPPATEQPAPGVPQAPVVEAVPKAQPTRKPARGKGDSRSEGAGFQRREE